jgi:hypothetical protein
MLNVPLRMHLAANCCTRFKVSVRPGWQTSVCSADGLLAIP